MAEPSRTRGAAAPAGGHLWFAGAWTGPVEAREEARVGRGNGSRLDADLLTGAEIELLMRRCSRRAPTGVRNRALIAVLWRCGLRLGEALALKAKDFDPDAGTLVVQRGQGRQAAGRRRRRRHRRARRPLARAAPQAGHRRRHRCSARSRAGRWTSRYVRHLLPRLARKAGVERRVHAHGLRHAFAVDLVRAGAPLYVVRDALGHSSVATTQVYLSRVGAHEAVDAMRNRDWAISA